MDANLLLYAVEPNFPQHAAARTWLDQQLSGSARVGLPWPSLLAFLRVTTNPRVFRRPMAMSDAWARMEDWLAVDIVWVPPATERHPEIFGQLLAAPGVVGDLVPDAHIAALAIEHGLQLCSADGDFARFPRLRWSNPLRP